MKTTIKVDNELLNRARAAYFRSNPDDTVASNSVYLDSRAATFGGHKYVVIRGRQGRGASVETFAVYRVRNDGMLRRLRRYPAALNFLDDK
jgi:hypothetical protein